MMNTEYSVAEMWFGTVEKKGIFRVLISTQNFVEILKKQSHSGRRQLKWPFLN